MKKLLLILMMVFTLSIVQTTKPMRQAATTVYHFSQTIAGCLAVYCISQILLEIYKGEKKLIENSNIPLKKKVVEVTEKSSFIIAILITGYTTLNIGARNLAHDLGY